MSASQPVPKYIETRSGSQAGLGRPQNWPRCAVLSTGSGPVWFSGLWRLISSGFRTLAKRGFMHHISRAVIGPGAALPRSPAGLWRWRLESVPSMWMASRLGQLQAGKASIRGWGKNEVALRQSISNPSGDCSGLRCGEREESFQKGRFPW